MKDTVNVIFEFPREDFAVLKYMCVKKNMTIKKLVGTAVRQLTADFLEEESAKEDNVNLSSNLEIINE